MSTQDKIKKIIIINNDRTLFEHASVCDHGLMLVFMRQLVIPITGPIN